MVNFIRSSSWCCSTSLADDSLFFFKTKSAVSCPCNMISVKLSQLSVSQGQFAPCWSCFSPSNAALKLPRETSICFINWRGLMKWCYCCVYLVWLLIQTALPWVDLQSQLPMYWHHVAGDRYEGSKYQVFQQGAILIIFIITKLHWISRILYIDLLHLYPALPLFSWNLASGNGTNKHRQIRHWAADSVYWLSHCFHCCLAQNHHKPVNPYMPSKLFLGKQPLCIFGQQSPVCHIFFRAYPQKKEKHQSQSFASIHCPPQCSSLSFATLYLQSNKANGDLFKLSALLQLASSILHGLIQQYH